MFLIFDTVYLAQLSMECLRSWLD